MFVLPLFALPFVVVLAVYRLWRIPRRLQTGEWQLVRRRGGLRPTITVLAYLVLLAHTGVLLGAMAFLFTEAALAHAGDLLLIAGTYPLVYIAAEWVMHDGFKRQPD